MAKQSAHYMWAVFNETKTQLYDVLAIRLAARNVARLYRLNYPKDKIVVKPASLLIYFAEKG